MFYDITEKEIHDFKESYILSIEPLRFHEIPAREKRKYIMLCIIIHQMDKDKIYHEIELNALLKPMVEDYVMIRRYLVDYGFLKRVKDGSKYWLDCDVNTYQPFKLS